ncbi:hydroxysqualene dehydroxylase [Mycolicibacterium fortuitum]|uniref:Polyprenyl synthetase n=1 Tax=Mycolicibacterium fortuitum subsp. fortuitum DSM 46621 = ATCC 6841 = JCM 6387 TaxID=1214102 RepID=K0VXH9_MYCFO|nr:FAD-dependent oxidoreductase [Mycolicibacterium fortuitum]AIY45037.1 Phytoene desaturase [Mycobacterium sp. VKM Ac-1817D]CRL80209.1 amine oxidase [Mycolicibacter nonchromogenicus]EJZ16184.1 polyprenyl synthetase [Mycolicibacterium fortuitum subsp. fortuitum DSM 46621 = ATCC 6841 = JCM 6387]NOR01683.1 FAD-dependent oxidoreductase [Mycolicibacterium fortuitum]OBJ96954.1 polyprenyl synthetase [Mycolicibacterium fortuitum]
MTTVAVLGGGIGGLTAAHELADRGFDVTVYERHSAFGGKARSMPFPGSATGGRKDLPGEHGFRFFPGFYRHVPDTMVRIPHNGQTVADHLVTATQMMLAQHMGANEIIVATQVASAFDDLSATMKAIWQLGVGLGIPPQEMTAFVERLLTLLASCDERRFGQWEQTSWWDFIGAANRSPQFQKFLANGMTRTLVAAKATEISARTGGLILCQLMFDLVRPNGKMDRVLDGPTSDVWIDPWLTHLAGLGVNLCDGYEVTGIDCDGAKITGVSMSVDGHTEQIVADHYVAAMPKERLQLLLTPALCAAEPRLTGLPQLKTDWMNGAMFYLDVDKPLVHGHAIFIDSKWSLTAISQGQFWRNFNWANRGDGRVEGILSVDISAWDVPGSTSYQANVCSRDEIRTEVWKQITDHIDDGSLTEANVIGFFLDPAITFGTGPNRPKSKNDEPLLINTKGSWANRPDAVTALPNFFLAADFVRTYTDLATMEAANEAARRAVNGILDATGSPASRCPVWPLHEPRALEPFRRLDKLRWRLGQGPVKPPIKIDLAGIPETTGALARGLLALLGDSG